LAPPVDVAAAGIATACLLGVTWRRRRERTNGSTTRTIGAPAASTRGAEPRNAPDPAHRARRAAVAGLVVAIAVTGSVVAARPSGSPRVSILDVGQGDGILVEGSHGSRLLIDGGPDPDRLLVTLDRRIPPWDRRIDAVVLSHPHEDHVAGLALLLERYHVTRVFEPGMRGPGPGYAAWLRELAAPGAPIRLSIAAGDRLAVDEIDLRVLWPVRGQVPATPPDGGTGINNVSVVFLGHVGARRFLLMGDVEEGIDPTLLTGGLPRVDRRVPSR
jgi:competence protein ComEC